MNKLTFGIIVFAFCVVCGVIAANANNISGFFTLSDTETKTPFQIALSNGLQEYSELHSNIGVMAIHGGAIDKGTEQITRCVTEKTDVSYYIASGRKPSNNVNLSVASNSIKQTDSQKLNDFIFSIKTGISILGHNKDDKIYVGGLNKELRLKIALQLAKAFPGRVISDISRMSNEFSAISETNIINASIYKGVQIDLPKSLRPYDNDYDSSIKEEPYLSVCNAIANALN